MKKFKMKTYDQIEIILFIAIGIGLIFLFKYMIEFFKSKLKDKKKNKKTFSLNFKIKSTIFSLFGKTLKEVLLNSNLRYIPVLFLTEYGNFILCRGEHNIKKNIMTFNINNKEYKKPLTEPNLINFKNNFTPDKKSLNESCVFFTDENASSNMRVIPETPTNVKHIALEYFQKVVDTKDIFIGNNMLDMDGNQRKILLLMFMSGGGIFSIIWIVVFLIFILIF